MMKKCIVLFLIFSFGLNAQEKLNVYFDFDKYNLNEQAIKSINTWIAEGKNYQVIKLYGFCDSKGTNSYNDTLALKRVNELYNFLKESEIEVLKDIEIRGFGEDFKQSKVQDENRRVTIIYTSKIDKVVEEPPTPLQKQFTEKIKSAKKGDLLKLDNIYFYNNSAKVVTKSEPILYELLCVMVDNPTLRIEIQGHICCKRPNEPEVVSTARARAVYNYLIRNKIERTRMTFKGYGVSRPIHPIPEKNAIEEDDNRRVEILIKER
jgi:outer membrane protein OmpA-like peptidoglycan-associated protein